MRIVTACLRVAALLAFVMLVASAVGGG